MAFAKINGQEIHFEDSQGSGPALIFMHGFLMDHTMFDPQVEVLAPQYRCIRWDARAFGNTRWDGKPFNLYDTAADCMGLMDHLKIDSAILVGMSQGGYAALRAAFTYPKRVRGLVLMSTRSSVDEPAIQEMYRQTRDTWKTAGPVDPMMEGLASALLGPKTAPGMQELWGKWVALWKKIPGENIFHGMNNLLDRDEIDARLKEISCPALVTHGVEDFGIPCQLGEKLSRDLPDCRGFVMVPGAVHAANLTHPESINLGMLKFLDEVFRNFPDPFDHRRSLGQKL